MWGPTSGTGWEQSAGMMTWSGSGVRGWTGRLTGRVGSSDQLGYTQVYNKYSIYDESKHNIC
jgi:hypothetical protein